MEAAAGQGPLYIICVHEYLVQLPVCVMPVDLQQIIICFSIGDNFNAF